MSEALFLRVLDAADKEGTLRSIIDQVAKGAPCSDTAYTADPSDFSDIPGSPFAYWASEDIRRLFKTLPPFEGNGRTVKQGLATADDFRFVRAWWEVDPEKVLTGTAETTPEEFRRATFEGKKWVPFAKGGEYSPYYADLHLVVNWENDGEEIRAFSDPESGRQYSRPQNTDYYFRPGITWPSRTNGLSLRILPAGTIFSHKGPAALVVRDDRHALLALTSVMNSAVFLELISTMVARTSLAQSYEVGMIQQVPIPNLLPADYVELARHVSELVRQTQVREAPSELCHLFAGTGVTQDLSADITPELAGSVEGLYGMDVGQRLLGASVDLASEDNEEDTERTPPKVDTRHISFCLGCLFGRWDIRLAKNGRSAPEPPDPFAPLPVCSPGMLVGPAGLPAGPGDVPADYPVPIKWDGVIPDDEGHPDDLVAGIHRILVLMYPEHDPITLEADVCRDMGVENLRAWLSSKFSTAHVKLYSRSQRKAPIYWQLRSSSGSYSIWLYYHRINGDTLWRVLHDYVDPKITHEQQKLDDLEGRLASARATGAGRQERDVGRSIEKQKALLEELTLFRADIREAAEMGYEPDRDDGVIVNIAPLHKLVPWPEAAAMWKELLAGKYPWSTMSKRLKAAGLLKKRHGG